MVPRSSRSPATPPAAVAAVLPPPPLKVMVREVAPVRLMLASELLLMSKSPKVCEVLRVSADWEFVASISASSVVMGIPLGVQFPAVSKVVAPEFSVLVPANAGRLAVRVAKTIARSERVSVGVFMERDAGWLVGGIRVFESLRQRVWEEDSTRVLLGESAGEVMTEELGSVVFAKNNQFGNRTHVRYLN